MRATSPMRQPAFEIVLQHLDGYAELLLIGDLDIGSAPILRDAVDRLMAEGHYDVRLNLSALQFLDAIGVGLLAGANQQLIELGGRLTVTAVRGIPLQVLTICAMLEHLTARGSRPTTNAQKIQP